MKVGGEGVDDDVDVDMDDDDMTVRMVAPHVCTHVGGVTAVFHHRSA